MERSCGETPGHPSIPAGSPGSWCTAASCPKGCWRKSWKAILQCSPSCPRKTAEHGKAPRARAAASPRGDVDLPSSTLSSPPAATSRRAPGQHRCFVFKTQKHNGSSGGNRPGPCWGRDRGTARAARGRCCHWRCSCAHPSLAALASHLHGGKCGKGKYRSNIPKLPSCSCQPCHVPRVPHPVVGPGRPGGSRSCPHTAVTGSVQGSRVIVPGCFPAGRPRGQLAAASLEQRGLF